MNIPVNIHSNTRGRRVQTCAALAVLLVAGASCSPLGAHDSAADDIAATAAQVRALTETHTRVVWCQDIGDGADTFAQGDNLRLMGYDSEDGRGERVILSGPSNYSRPLITPRGDRVIFSRRGEEEVYIVGWDGSGMARLGDGLAVSVWSDPSDGTEWVYVGTRIDDSETVRDLRRFPIDRPDAEELVWNLTPIQADNVQVSADGRHASGAFPWPHCGIAGLPNLGWQKLARGCWPSISPDNSRLVWVFDGAHRNLSMFLFGTEKRWQVRINTAPGIDGHEVYHPRWSNHMRIMAMTGPYTVGASANRIRGGGADVEIYMGRFAEDFGTIERWARVTDNPYANFFPDVWVKPEPRDAVPAETEIATAGRPDITADWPGCRRGMVFLWENRSKDNEIRDAEGRTVRVCRAEPAGLAKYGRHFEMDLEGGFFVAESDPKELLAEYMEGDRLAIEAVITPRRADLRDFAGIISFGCLKDGFNFMLGQKNDELVFRLRASGKDRDGAQVDSYSMSELSAGESHHAIVSLGPEGLSCFLNGERVFSTSKVAGGFSGWTEQPLIFGHDGGEGWPGTLEGIALYSRTIEEKEAEQKFALYAVRLEERGQPDALVFDARLKEASGIPTPESIAPYRRALIANLYEVDKVIEGQLPTNLVLVAHWAIMDGRVLDAAEREVGTVYRIASEPYESRPELEGERLVMDSDEFALPMYYDLGR